MTINPKYLELLKTHDIEEAKGLFFGFLVTFREQFPSLSEYILDDHVLPYEEFMILQINLCTLNTDTGKNELKVKFFGNIIDNNEFQAFLTLLSLRHINAKGHANNQLTFSIFGHNDEDAFQKTKRNLGKDFDLTLLAETVADYYQSSTYATKLDKYLGTTNVLQDYKQRL